MLKHFNSPLIKDGKSKWSTLSEILFGNDKRWSIHRLILYSSLCLCVCFLGLIQQEPEKRQTNYKNQLMKFDTLIPKDKTLLPIEIENSEALDSLFGNQGVVDLYVRQSPGSRKLRLIAKNVKLMRAPKNPKVFAVLCDRSMPSQIFSGSQSFFVSLLNPNNSGTKLVTTKRKSNLEVDYL